MQNVFMYISVCEMLIWYGGVNVEVDSGCVLAEMKASRREGLSCGVSLEMIFI